MIDIKSAILDGLRQPSLDQARGRTEDRFRVDWLIEWAVRQGATRRPDFIRPLCENQRTAEQLRRLMAFADYDESRGSGKRMAWGEQEGPSVW